MYRGSFWANPWLCFSFSPVPSVWPAYPVLSKTPPQFIENSPLLKVGQVPPTLPLISMAFPSPLQESGKPVEQPSLKPYSIFVCK